MALTDATGNLVLEAIFGGDTYTGGTMTMKLFKVGLPSTTGVEVTGGGYAAQTLAYGAASGKSISTSSPATFTDLPTDTIVAYGVYQGATLKDEGLLTPSFTADVTNNTLEINHTYTLNE